MDSSTALHMRRRHWYLRPAAAEEGLRLDQFLALHCQDLSRGMLRRIVDLGGVHVAGRRVRQCSRLVHAGEEIAVYCDGLPLDVYHIQEGDILWRDRDLLALNKPAGVDTQPTPARYQGTLYAALLHLLKDPARPHLEPSLGMVQRLDRDTSGVILFSISSRAHKPLTAMMSSRQVQKRYLALVAGLPPAGWQEIRSLLARCRDNRVRSVARGGQEAVTRYHLVQPLRDAALIEVELVTGRMHQIRAHLSEAGYPLLGDARYEGPMELDGVAISRQMLHARSITLPHPVTQSPLHIESPLPRDMDTLLHFLTPESISVPEKPHVDPSAD